MDRTHISPNFASGTTSISVPSGEIWEVAIYSDATHQESKISTTSDNYYLNSTGQMDNSGYQTHRHYYITSDGSTEIVPGGDNGDGVVTGWKLDTANSKMSDVFQEVSDTGSFDIPTNEVWHVAVYQGHTLTTTDRFKIRNTSGTEFARLSATANTENNFEAPALYTFADGMQIYADGDELVMMGFKETV